MSKNKQSRKHKRQRREGNTWRDDRQLQPGYYLPIHPGLTEVTCPDCGAHWEAPEPQRRAGAGGALEHAPTCPIGKGYADASDDDRAWFAAHPGETERVRVPTMAEVQAVMLATGQHLPDIPMGVSYAPGGEVVVRKLSDGLRSRNFSGAVLLANPVLPSPAHADIDYDADEYDEHGVHWFREHAVPRETGDDDGLWAW